MTQTYQYGFRDALPEDAQSVSALIGSAFTSVDVPDWSPSALKRFHEQHAPDLLEVAIATATYHQVCERDGELVGYIACARPAMLSLLAVRPSLRGTGIGRALVERAFGHIDRRHPEVSVVEVNANPVAEPFYRALGFFPLSAVVRLDDISFIRMGCWRGLRRMQRQADD